MDYIIENWGGFVGILGVFVSAAGLWYAYGARRAAKSAEEAAKDARQALTRTLSLVDVERAVALISRLKLLHRIGHWDSALELYQYLRRMLSDIYANTPAELNEIRVALSEAIPRITDIENQVASDQNENKFSENSPKLVAILNGIQENLEKLQSSDIYGE